MISHHQVSLLWELLHPVAFNIPTHLGVASYPRNAKVNVLALSLLASGLGSYSLFVQETVTLP